MAGWLDQGKSEILRLDREVLLYFNGMGQEFMDPFWVTVTRMETWIPLFLFCSFLYFYHYTPRAAFIRLGSTVLLGTVVLGLMGFTKNTVGRLRPNNQPELEGLVRVLQNPQDYSFFSGHAATSFALSLFVYLQLRHRFPWLILLFIWPLMFASSRIYVGVHYPLDILVGSVVGICSALLAQRIIPPDPYSSRHARVK